MKIHEFQAKEVLKKFGVPVQDGIAIKSVSEFDAVIFSFILSTPSLTF